MNKTIYTKDYDWIFSEVNDPEFEKKMEEVEKALGFNLFLWQKYYIMTGTFRCYGKTTAEILRLLLDPDVNHPIDLSLYSRYDYFGHMVRDIKKKLHAAGIKTNDVIFSKYGLKRDCDNKNEKSHVGKAVPITFDDGKEAVDILKELKRIGKEFGVVTIRDYKDICNIESESNDDDLYGWYAAEVEKPWFRIETKITFGLSTSQERCYLADKRKEIFYDRIK